jgi:hypothetical protein
MLFPYRPLPDQHALQIHYGTRLLFASSDLLDALLLDITIPLLQPPIPTERCFVG